VDGIRKRAPRDVANMKKWKVGGKCLCRFEQVAIEELNKDGIPSEVFDGCGHLSSRELDIYPISKRGLAISKYFESLYKELSGLRININYPQFYDYMEKLWKLAMDSKSKAQLDIAKGKGRRFVDDVNAQLSSANAAFKLVWGMSLFENYY